MCVKKIFQEKKFGKHLESQKHLNNLGRRRKKHGSFCKTTLFPKAQEETLQSDKHLV